MGVMVIVNFKAAEGQAEALLSLLQKGREVSLKADGCETFDLYQRQDEPHKFVFVERWASLEAHHANMANNIVATGHLKSLLPLLAEPIDNGVMRDVG